MFRVLMVGVLILAATPALAEPCDQLDRLTPRYTMPLGTVVDSLTYSDDMTELNRRVVLLAKCLADNRQLTTELFELAKQQDAELRLLRARPASSH